MSVIRNIKKEDFQDICKLIKNEEELFLVYPNGSYPLTVSQIEELSEKRKDLTVMEKENEIIGFANYYDFQPLKFAFIGNVIIDVKHRYIGLGKKLVTHMLSTAFEKHNLPEIRISVFNSNTRALLLYSSMGFTPYDIESKIDSLGTKVALIHMKKERERATQKI